MASSPTIKGCVSTCLVVSSCCQSCVAIPDMIDPHHTIHENHSAERRRGTYIKVGLSSSETRKALSGLPFDEGSKRLTEESRSLFNSGGLLRSRY